MSVPTMLQIGIGTKFICMTVVLIGVVGLVSGLYSNILLAIDSGSANNGTNSTTLAPSQVMFGY